MSGDKAPTWQTAAVAAGSAAAVAAALAKMHDQYVVSRPMASIETAIEAFRNGIPCVVMDDEDRENEGDIIVPAGALTEEMSTIMINHTTGILCAPMTEERASMLGLGPMLANNQDPKGTAFTVTTDLKPTVPKDSGLIPDLADADGETGLTTGVSAYDRMITFKALAHPKARATDFGRPGHIFPLRAKRGGVPERRGHTEASVDLCRLANCVPVGAIGELVNETGEMKRLDDCKRFGYKFGYPCITIDALVNYLYRKPLAMPTANVAVNLAATCTIPVTREGRFLGIWDMSCYVEAGRHEHVVLSLGDISASDAVPVRIHSECLTGDLIGSMRCDCGEQLNAAFRHIADKGVGVIIYMTGHEGRGIGLINKMHAYQLQSNEGYDTYRANRELGFQDDMRSFDACAEIIKQMGMQSKTVQLLTNSPLKVRGMAALKGNVKIEVVPLLCKHNEYNQRYLTDKRNHEARLREGGLASRPENIRTSLRLSDRAHISLVPKLRVAIIQTVWFHTPLKALKKQVIRHLNEAGVTSENICTIEVAGAQDIPFAARTVALTGKVDAVLCLGITIQGEVKQAFSCLSSAVSHGVNAVQTETGVPTLFGVIACKQQQQAIDRCSEGSELAYSLALSTIQVATERHIFSPAKAGALPSFSQDGATSPLGSKPKVLSSSTASNETQVQGLADLIVHPSAAEMPNLKIVVVAAAWQGRYVDSVVNGLTEELISHGVDGNNIGVVRVPTIFNIPHAAAVAAASGVDAVVTCGFLVKDETSHFDYVAQAHAIGTLHTQLRCTIPIVSGVLLTNTEEMLTQRAPDVPHPLAASVLHQIAFAREVSGVKKSPATLFMFGSQPGAEEATLVAEPASMLKVLTAPTAVQAKSIRVGIVRTAWNESFVEEMAAGITTYLTDAGVASVNIVERVVPGSYELPTGARITADAEAVDVVVCLGVLLKGDTKHFEYICESTSDALLKTEAATEVPIVWGVLTCQTIDQAKERAVSAEMHAEWGASALHLALLRDQSPAAKKGAKARMTPVQTREIPPTSLRKALVGELVKDIPRTLKAPAADVAESMSIAVVATSNEEYALVRQMVDGISAVFSAAGLPEVNVVTQWVPTSFDLPHAVNCILESTPVLAVLAVGMSHIKQPDLLAIRLYRF